MPWTVDDVDRHKRGLSAKQKRQWVAVANSVLERCQQEGGRDCEAKAVRQANAAVSEAMMRDELERLTTRLQSLTEAGRVLSAANEAKIRTAIAALQEILAQLANGEDVPGQQQEAAVLRARQLLQEELSFGDRERAVRAALQATKPPDVFCFILDLYDDRVIYEEESPNSSETYQRSYTIDASGEVTLGDPVRVVRQVIYVPVGEAERGGKMFKTEDGKLFPASDYAYVPDPQKPSTWKLRLTSEPGGPPDPRIVGMAIAALGKGFRGQKVDIPEEDLPKVKAKVRAAWRKANPDKSDDEMPEAIREAADELVGDLVPLVEKAVRKDGTISIKVIEPGQGSSGYYPAEVLKRDGPKVFTKGLQMFLDHPTAAEEADRPERSIRDLAGVLVSDARWEENGPAGPGLYAEAKVRSDLAPLIEEIAPHIGVSIRALGRAKAGEVDGKKTRVIEAIEQAKSVDFVTQPGAGGRVLQLIEAARSRQNTLEGEEMQLEEARRQLEEQAKELARLREALLLREARDVVSETLARISMPEPTRQRLLESLSGNPPTKDGALDREELTKRVQEAATAELEYLAKVTGSGQVRGMGSSSGATPSVDEARKQLKQAFIRLGLSESAAEIAAAGRH